jgi:ketosteroid isomerase-like protein
MKLNTVIAGLLALLFGLSVNLSAATAETQFPKPSKNNADAKTMEEFRQFYEEIEKALKAENVTKIMSFYADDYLHHGITKKQLKFMWLEVFGNFDELYSVHVFTKITVYGNDAILVCTGGLFGVVSKGEDYTTVDQWVTENHWLTKVDGKWKMIGGATRPSPRQRGGRMELHPFF